MEKSCFCRETHFSWRRNRCLDVKTLNRLIAVAAAVLAAGCAQLPKDHARAAASTGDGEAWGISCLSVASAREAPSHKAEMGTQILMGGVVRVLNQSTNQSRLMVLACFVVICKVSRDGTNVGIEELAGLHRRAPLLAVTLAVGVFALAGIPPFVSPLSNYRFAGGKTNRAATTILLQNGPT